MPLFFGPSGALVDYLPRRLRILNERCPELSVRILNPLFVSETNGGKQLIAILYDQIMEIVSSKKLEEFEIVLVDHGSPSRAVTAVRDTLAKMLKTEFETNRVLVTPASMERRSGDEYAFNEPLLENFLREKIATSNSIILSQLFLSPGRHAGPGGDIESICENAQNPETQLKLFRTELVGVHPMLIDLLVNRWDEREKIDALEF